MDDLQQFVLAYVPEDYLDFEDALALANERDEQAAIDLLMSVEFPDDKLMWLEAYDD